MYARARARTPGRPRDVIARKTWSLHYDIEAR